MEILIEKSKLADMNLIKGFRWEVEAIRKELRPLQAASGGYDMEINRLTNEIQLLKSKSLLSTLDFVVYTRENDRLQSALDAYREEHSARHEKEKDRIIELEECLEVVLARMNQFVIIDVRPMLSENENESI